MTEEFLAQLMKKMKYKSGMVTRRVRLKALDLSLKVKMGKTKGLPMMQTSLRRACSMAWREGEGP